MFVVARISVWVRLLDSDGQVISSSMANKSKSTDHRQRRLDKVIEGADFLLPLQRCCWVVPDKEISKIRRLDVSIEIRGHQEEDALLNEALTKCLVRLTVESSDEIGKFRMDRHICGWRVPTLRQARDKHRSSILLIFPIFCLSPGCQKFPS